MLKTQLSILVLEYEKRVRGDDEDKARTEQLTNHESKDHEER